MSNARGPLVMVITLWHEDGGDVRARIVHGTTDARNTVACASVQDLLDTVRALTESWDRSPPAASD